MALNDREILGFAIFMVLIIFLLSEITYQLSNVKIMLAIKPDFGRVIEGEAREVPDKPVSD